MACLSFQLEWVAFFSWFEYDVDGPFTVHRPWLAHSCLLQKVYQLLVKKKAGRADPLFLIVSCLCIIDVAAEQHLAALFSLFRFAFSFTVLQTAIDFPSICKSLALKRQGARGSHSDDCENDKSKKKSSYKIQWMSWCWRFSCKRTVGFWVLGQYVGKYKQGLTLSFFRCLSKGQVNLYFTCPNTKFLCKHYIK